MSFGSPLLAAWAHARPPATPPITEQDEMAGAEQEHKAGDGQTIPDLSTGSVGTTVGMKRKLQCVSTKATKVKVLNWMQDHVQEQGTEVNLMSDTVRQFPEVFRAESRSANLMKCSRWWAIKDELWEDFEQDQLSISHTVVGRRKRSELKARPGRGRKISEWCSWLYPLVRNEFDLLRKAGVKFSPSILELVAKHVLHSSPHPTFGPTTVLSDSEKPLIDRITPRSVQQFQEVQNIVHRHQCGKQQVSPKKTEFIERSTAYHMGQLARGFADGLLNENLLENMDETHFVVNMDNKKTLGFQGDTEVRYADVVSGGIGITMAVKVTGGRTAKISCPFLIFQNLNSSYPIHGTPDNVVGVCYRSSPSSFMTSKLLTEYYNEPRVSWANPHGCTKIQFIDNYPGHNVIPSCAAALARIKTTLKYFPANSTHLTQPCDSFVISKIKDAWRRRWDAKKLEMIQAGMWQGDGQAGTSGALKNPGWSFFLQIATDSVRDVNSQIDSHYGITYARKAMIRCGLSLNLEGQWDVKQLTPELQEIITKYKSNFDGCREFLTQSNSTSTVGSQRASQATAAGTEAGRGRASRPAMSTIDVGPSRARRPPAGATDAGPSRAPRRNADGSSRARSRSVRRGDAVSRASRGSIDVDGVESCRAAPLAANVSIEGLIEVASLAPSNQAEELQNLTQESGDNGENDTQGLSDIYQDAQLPESLDIELAEQLELDPGFTVQSMQPTISQDMAPSIFCSFRCMFLPVGVQTPEIESYTIRGGSRVNFCTDETDFIVAESWEEVVEHFKPHPGLMQQFMADDIRPVSYTSLMNCLESGCVVHEGPFLLSPDLNDCQFEVLGTSEWASKEISSLRTAEQIRERQCLYEQGVAAEFDRVEKENLEKNEKFIELFNPDARVKRLRQTSPLEFSPPR